MAGILYVVATPLGNLGDWSARAREIVEKADLVLVEDSRVSNRLFQPFGLHPKIRVYEKHRERRETEAVLGLIAAGQTVALVSDAGTPGIADPGSILVGAAHAAGIEVRAVPGPSILPAVLSVAGEFPLPVTFHGYPPEGGATRRSLWESLRGDPGSHVLLIPPHDAAAVLNELGAALPGRNLVLARELTKVHEQVIAGTAAGIVARLEGEDALRGEMALVVFGAPAEKAALELADLIREAKSLRDTYGLTGHDWVDFLAFKTGAPRKTAYRAVEAAKTG